MLVLSIFIVFSLLAIPGIIYRSADPLASSASRQRIGRRSSSAIWDLDMTSSCTCERRAVRRCLISELNALRS